MTIPQTSSAGNALVFQVSWVLWMGKMRGWESASLWNGEDRFAICNRHSLSSFLHCHFLYAPKLMRVNIIFCSSTYPQTDSSSVCRPVSDSMPARPAASPLQCSHILQATGRQGHSLGECKMKRATWKGKSFLVLWNVKKCLRFNDYHRKVILGPRYQLIFKFHRNSI